MSDGGTAGGLVLVLTLPERSAVNAVFALSRRLLERGHRVVHCCSPEMERHVVRQGLECQVFDFYGRVCFADALRRLSALSCLRRAGPQARLWSEIYRHVLGQLREWLAVHRPDVVVLDQLMWPYAVPFVEADISILGLSATFASVRNRFAPPVFSDVVPRACGGGWQQLANLRSWARLDALWAMARVRHKLFLGLSRDRWGWRDLDPERAAARHGLRLRRGEYGWRLDVPELVLAPSELDFPGAVRANPRCYAGSCVDTRREDVPFAWQRLDPQKALIYCSLGTYSHRYPNAERLFRTAIDVAWRRPEWQMIIQVGEVAATGLLRSVPENVVVTAEAPQLKLLEKATLSISHGGLSSVREAIFYGVPMLLFPCWFDQWGNAARVSYHHLGMTGDIRRISGSRLLCMMERLLGKESCRHSMARMQQIFRQQAGCQPGVDCIETFLPKPPSRQAMLNSE